MAKLLSTLADGGEAAPLRGGHCALASSVPSIIVRVINPDHPDRLKYHVLPIDDPLRAVNILREAAGLPPLPDEHDDEGY